MFARLNICICDLHICMYGDIYPCTQPVLHIYIYIYIYMQCKTLKYRAQTTNASGSCSQHSITKHQSLLEVTVGFYRETSRWHKHSLEYSSTTNCY